MVWPTSHCGHPKGDDDTLHVYNFVAWKKMVFIRIITLHIPGTY